jgi:hypothetical protein
MRPSRLSVVLILLDSYRTNFILISSDKSLRVVNSFLYSIFRSVLPCSTCNSKQGCIGQIPINARDLDVVYGRELSSKFVENGKVVKFNIELCPSLVGNHDFIFVRITYIGLHAVSMTWKYRACSSNNER